MGGPDVAGKPRFKNRGEWRRPGKGPHDDVEVRVAYGLANSETLARFLDGVELQEFRITNLTEDCRVMLKGNRGTSPVVAYFYAPTWRDALRLAVSSLDTGNARWELDDYPLKNARPPSVSPPIPRKQAIGGVQRLTF